MPCVRRTGASRGVPNSTARRPSRRRFVAHASALGVTRPRSDATARRRRPFQSRARASTVHLAGARELRSSRYPRAWSRSLSRAAGALVNTDADGCALFPRIPLTHSPTSRAQVHTANHVARRHARSWLCEHCHNGGGTVRAGSPELGECETHLAGLGRTLTLNPIRAPRPGGSSALFTGRDSRTETQTIGKRAPNVDRAVPLSDRRKRISISTD